MASKRRERPRSERSASGAHGQKVGFYPRDDQRIKELIQKVNKYHTYHKVTRAEIVRAGVFLAYETDIEELSNILKELRN